MGARNLIGIGLSYRSTRLHRLAGIHSLESIPGLYKRLKIRALRLEQEYQKRYREGGGEDNG
jgi:hypothetical protein